MLLFLNLHVAMRAVHEVFQLHCLPFASWISSSNQWWNFSIALRVGNLRIC
jgi:hypothetical protein